MKILFPLILFCLFYGCATSPTILINRSMDVVNACDAHKIYVLTSDKAGPMKSMDSIEPDLNKSVLFAKQHPDFTGVFALEFVVNCRGELGSNFGIQVKSGVKELDQEIIQFMRTIKIWTPGKLKRQPVDSWTSWQFSISDGYISIKNLINKR